MIEESGKIKNGASRITILRMSYKTAALKATIQESGIEYLRILPSYAPTIFAVQILTPWPFYPAYKEKDKKPLSFFGRNVNF
jgi:hypothetical protein